MHSITWVSCSYLGFGVWTYISLGFVSKLRNTRFYLFLPSKQQPPGKQSHRAVSNGMVRPRTGNVRPQGEFGSNRGVMQPVIGKIAASQATNWRVLCVWLEAIPMSKQVQVRLLDMCRDQSRETSPNFRSRFFCMAAWVYSYCKVAQVVLDLLSNHALFLGTSQQISPWISKKWLRLVEFGPSLQDRDATPAGEEDGWLGDFAMGDDGGWLYFVGNAPWMWRI